MRPTLLYCLIDCRRHQATLITEGVGKGVKLVDHLRLGVYNRLREVAVSVNVEVPLCQLEAPTAGFIESDHRLADISVAWCL